MMLFLLAYIYLHCFSLKTCRLFTLIKYKLIKKHLEVCGFDAVQLTRSDTIFQLLFSSYVCQFPFFFNCFFRSNIASSGLQCFYSLYQESFHKGISASVLVLSSKKNMMLTLSQTNQGVTVWFHILDTTSLTGIFLK